MKTWQELKDKLDELTDEQLATNICISTDGEFYGVSRFERLPQVTFHIAVAGEDDVLDEGNPFLRLEI